MCPLNLVVEDSLSESICRRLLASSSLQVGHVYGKEGVGYIKTRLRAFNNAAKGSRYLIVADLDRFGCVAELWQKWAPGVQRHPNLLFRVAVCEIESWLLADTSNLCRFFGLQQRQQIYNSDQVNDPKRELLELAIRSPKKLLRDAVTYRDQHGTLLQGPDYNGTLHRFVQNQWNLKNAARASDSLTRALNALRRFSPA